MDRNGYFRAIPKVDALLERPEISGLFKEYGRELTVECVREATEELRAFIAASEDEERIRCRTQSLAADIADRVRGLFRCDLRPVINGTGTVLHTNLGRAVISKGHAGRLQSLISGYSNLEYDLEAGERGERYSHFEKLICRITGAEAAMAVNNNAGAVLLALAALGAGGEMPVSRGELVEIGGKFRIPDVMAQSGVRMVEVGTTNRTRIEDYEEAITENTRALLKVHTSNYRIVGFSQSVAAGELVKLGGKHGLPVIEDIGSGVLIDLSKYGLAYEPTVQDSIKAGVALVCFSGDKLLGGPQAGIIAGRAGMVAKIKRHPLTRALRIDKFTAGALELTLREYQSEERAIRNIPVLRMLTRPYREIAESAEKLRGLIGAGDAEIAAADCQSQTGGGSMPLERLTSRAVSIRPNSMTTAAFEAALRRLPVPIVARVQEDRVYIDMRTVQPEEIPVMAEEILSLI